MATEDGVALKQFGTSAITGFVVVSVSETIASEGIDIPDEDGDIITQISNYGKKHVATLELIPKNGTSVPSVGATQAWTSPNTGSSVTGRIRSVDAVTQQKDVLKCTVTCEHVSGITYS